MKKLLLPLFAGLIALACSTFASAAEPASAGVVVTVQADSVQRRPGWSDSTATAVGSAVGGAAGYYATRHQSRSYVGSTVGALLGAALGRQIDRRAQHGYTIVVKLDDGRTVAVFDRNTHVAVGERVYIVADRLVSAGGAP